MLLVSAMLSYLNTQELFPSDDLAMDWVSSTLYWVDAAWARIEVLDFSTRYRAELLRTGPNTNPRAIAVEPQRR